MRFAKITIIRTTVPKRTTLNDELQWLGASLGLFSIRDKDKSCFRIFIELVKGLKTGIAYSSDELAEHLNLTRGTVVHHLNKLMESGLVTSEKNKYMLTVDSLEELIALVQSNVTKALDNLKPIAKELDERLGL